MRTLSFDQRRRLHDRLEQLLTKNDDGLWSYPKGYMDARVAEELGITIKQVGCHRVEHFGCLRAWRAPADRQDSATQEDLEALGRWVSQLQDGAIASVGQFTALRERVEALEAGQKRLEATVDALSRQVASGPSSTPSASSPWRDLISPLTRS